MTETAATCLFEVSWEVCNKVGGIYTVIRSKLPEATRIYRRGLLPPRPGPQDQPRFRGDGRGVLEPDPRGGGDQGDPLPFRPLEGPRRAQGDPRRLREEVRQGPAPLPALGGLRRRFHRRGMGLCGAGHVQLRLQRGDRDDPQPPRATPGDEQASPSFTNG